MTTKVGRLAKIVVSFIIRNCSPIFLFLDLQFVFYVKISFHDFCIIFKNVKKLLANIG